MTPILMSVAEPGFMPWIAESEEEAQVIALSLLAVLRNTVNASPSWAQYQFLQRAENAQRNRILTEPVPLRAVDRGSPHTRRIV